MERRLITLIFAGWVPHDYAASRSCLYLGSQVRLKALSNSVIEGSPNRGCASLDTVKMMSLCSVIASCCAVLFYIRW
jgi:hypothetical protein